MDFNEYQKMVENTAKYPKEIGLSYCTLGLTGEAGEVANKVKKIYRDKNGILSGEDKKVIALEVSDVIWYCVATSKELGYSFEEILQMNYDKLTQRKLDNTISGEGDYR